MSPRRGGGPGRRAEKVHGGAAKQEGIIAVGVIVCARRCRRAGVIYGDTREKRTPKRLAGTPRRPRGSRVSALGWPACRSWCRNDEPSGRIKPAVNVKFIFFFGTNAKYLVHGENTKQGSLGNQSFRLPRLPVGQSMQTHYRAIHFRHFIRYETIRRI